ncbi:MAG TPA: alpha-glucan family phosphorylase [Thermodesulfovibrionales bacterium]|nr:alpha-glucan family phosphorylase [Thermodesulfovibrionales bacterium]
MRDRLPNLPDKIAGLADIAYNLWWSWHPYARMLFKVLNRSAWKESGHNPVQMLRDYPAELLRSFAEDQDYLQQYEAVIARFREDIHTKICWFASSVKVSGCSPIAYFSAEYGLQHSLPFYAGGLGFLAGDYVKECSDLGIPMVAVGFMYPEGYLRQKMRVDGWQEDVDEVLDRDATPIVRVLDGKGEQLVVKVPFVDPPISIAVWKVDIGRVPLYLMDTDIEGNDPWNRRISAHLYISDIEQRLRQEMILGIGGIAVLNALGIRHSVIHLNEGHPAFATLERVRERIEEGMAFEQALEAVRATTVFTTHTPIPAGHDIFPFHLMDKYFSHCYPMLGLSRDRFFQLGIHPKEPAAGFNMTAFALRMSKYANAVSVRHGEVTRSMWQPLWPDKKEEDVPIASITNGIHVPTWIEPKMEMLLNKYLGPSWTEEHDDPAVWKAVENIPDQELWQVHYWLKIKLLNFIREQVRIRWTQSLEAPANIMAGGILLDPMTLTIGFARRFTSYKRADLIFSNLERLKRILNDRWRPVQFIFAGKAHPADNEGKRILQRVFNFAQSPEMGGKIAFIENYDEQLAQYMVHGVDVWLNNPQPPLEASGTSGMKASLNGVPHLSVLDGWWIEGYTGNNGWAFKSMGDEKDSESIYDLLEEKIVPLFYRTDSLGTPVEWVRIMKEAIKSTAARFSSRRMVKEYALKFYRSALDSTDKETNV